MKKKPASVHTTGYEQTDFAQFAKHLAEVDCVRRPPHKDDRPESWTPRMNTLVKVGKVAISRPGD